MSHLYRIQIASNANRFNAYGEPLSTIYFTFNPESANALGRIKTVADTERDALERGAQSAFQALLEMGRAYIEINEGMLDPDDQVRYEAALEEFKHISTGRG